MLRPACRAVSSIFDRSFAVQRTEIKLVFASLTRFRPRHGAMVLARGFVTSLVTARLLEAALMYVGQDESRPTGMQRGPCPLAKRDVERDCRGQFPCNITWLANRPNRDFYPIPSSFTFA